MEYLGGIILFSALAWLGYKVIHHIETSEKNIADIMSELDEHETAIQALTADSRQRGEDAVNKSK